ncbi:MAG: hypothetical protein C0501_25600 [Isosphaera sp.]|nr:hypothetical protein [Isosphaera sp.]
MTRPLLAAVLLAPAAGCGGDPPLHPVSGKVTLGKKVYPGLLVYFRPASGPPTGFNTGVGTTDGSGTLTVNSTAGPGLQAGEYAVTFTCVVPRAAAPGAKPLNPTDKPDEVGYGVAELVPASHREPGAADTTPVRFTVGPGPNTFDYDIPTP